MKYSELLIPVQKKFLELITGTTKSVLDSYELIAPPADGSPWIHHPAVEFLMREGVDWAEAYSAASDFCIPVQRGITYV